MLRTHEVTKPKVSYDGNTYDVTDDDIIRFAIGSDFVLIIHFGFKVLWKYKSSRFRIQSIFIICSSSKLLLIKVSAGHPEFIATKCNHGRMFQLLLQLSGQLEESATKLSFTHTHSVSAIHLGPLSRINESLTTSKGEKRKSVIIVIMMYANNWTSFFRAAITFVFHEFYLCISSFVRLNKLINWLLNACIAETEPLHFASR